MGIVAGAVDDDLVAMFVVSVVGYVLVFGIVVANGLEGGFAVCPVVWFESFAAVAAVAAAAVAAAAAAAAVDTAAL